MWSAEEGSTRRLIQLCIGYFSFYVLTGVMVKYFGSPADLGYPGLKDMEYLVYSTSGASLVCVIYAVAKGWYRLKSLRPVQILGLEVPSELSYIIPSGICTAIVVPTTTLMYTLPISVMVAMVIMRGAVIVISRAVDAIQIQQGILKKKVFWEENVAVVFALLAVSVNLWFEPSKSGGFDFLSSVPAVVILCSYVTSYAIRIYIMNYYKNTRPPGAPLDNKAFFGVEQIAASTAMLIFGFVAYHAPAWFDLSTPQLVDFHGAIANPKSSWAWASLSGVPFGVAAFFSVFLFMFKGRTATFAGLVNRLTSLVAGTTSTLLMVVLFNGKLPKTQDWASLGLILIAVAFLSRAERRRSAELALPGQPRPG
ncbi:MAG: hypothetical protein U1E65_20340 [Myxococcota bacterium]